jgi:hypothetical protein
MAHHETERANRTSAGELDWHAWVHLDWDAWVHLDWHARVHLDFTCLGASERDTELFKEWYCKKCKKIRARVARGEQLVEDDDEDDEDDEADDELLRAGSF